MRHVVLLLGYVGALLVQAQNWFGPEQTLYLNREDPKEFRAGDLDGDGDQDLACTFELDGQLMIFLNDGSGAQWQEVVFDGFNAPKGLELADVDGDGDIDLLMAESGADRVVWLANDGAGVFAAAQLLAELDGADILTIVDADNDADEDLLAHGTLGGTFLYRNQGGGGFSAGELVAPPSNARKMKVADMDGDLDLDLVMDDQSLPLRWYSNDDGSYSFAAEMPAPVTGFGWDIADVDADGDMDVALSGGYDLYYVIGDGSGGFAFQDPGSELWITYLISVHDVDADGDLDMLAAHSDIIPDPTLVPFVYLENHGTGLDGYEEHQLEYLDDPTFQQLRCLLADMDTDGDLDLVATGVNTAYTFSGDLIRWAAQDTSAMYDLRSLGDTIHRYQPLGMHLTGMADVDQDGWDEAVLTDLRRQALSVDQFGQPHLQDLLSFAEPSSGGASWFVDIDQDGLTDAVYAYPSSPDITVASGLGNANFGPSTILHPLDGFSNAVVTDHDGDGDMDIIYAGRDPLFEPEPDLAAILRNNGDGTFQAPVLIHSIDLDASMSVGGVADVDGDADMDVLLKIDPFGLPPARMLLFLDQGNGVFSFSDTLPTGLTYATGFADMNGDGTAEFMHLTTDGLRAHSFENGVWDTLGWLVDPIPGSSKILRDLDGDGDIDVLSSGSTWGMFVPMHIAWNDGQGGIASVEIPPNLTEAHPVDLAYPMDVDHDGLLDILSINSSQGTHISWFKGDNSLSIAADTPPTEGAHLLFPDPFTDQARISLAPWHGRPVEVSIVDATGAIVHQYRNVRGPEMAISREGLSSGLYMLRIGDGEGEVHAERFVIQ